MYEEWQKYEEEILKELYEKGLSGEKINIWEVLVEYPLNKTKNTWRCVKYLQDALTLPQFFLIPLNVKELWNIGIKPKTMIKLVETKRALPIAVTAPKSFKGQPEDIKQVIEITKDTYGFFPPCTQWRVDAYIAGLSRYPWSDVFHHKTYKQVGSWAHDILLKIGGK